MNIKAAFPPKFLKTEDLRGQRVTLVIERVQSQHLHDGQSKPVVFFQGRKKGLMLNKTNAFAIAEHHGEETEHWRGKRVTVFPALTDFQGQSVPCIRVEVPPDEAGQAAAPTF